jgi:hypothetical protein
MKLFGTPIVVLMTLTSFVFAVPLNPQLLPPGRTYIEAGSASSVKERITLSDWSDSFGRTLINRNALSLGTFKARFGGCVWQVFIHVCVSFKLYRREIKINIIAH